MRALILTCVLLLSGCTAPPVETAPPTTRTESPNDPMRPLHGNEPTAPSGLTLLVGDTVVTVDTGTRHRVTNEPDPTRVWPVAVGPDAVLSAHCPECGPNGGLYALPRGATSATMIGSGSNVGPAPDGVWVKRYQTTESCTLSKISLTGATLVAERPVGCDTTVREETPLGLLARIESAEPDGMEQILAVADLHPVVRAQRIHAVVGNRVLSSDDDGFVLTDRGSPTRLPAPTRIGHPSDGRVSPDGRYVEISFEHPAWPGPRQRLDAWLLDLTTNTWVHVPAMPVPTALKGTDEAWAPDGRLVILGNFDEVGTRVVYWRPGQDRLTIIRLTPEITTGSLVVR